MHDKFEMRTVSGTGVDKYGSKVSFEKGYFHTFGTGFVTVDKSIITRTVAIIELEDGTVVEAVPTDIKFTDVEKDIWNE